MPFTHGCLATTVRRERRFRRRVCRVKVCGWRSTASRMSREHENGPAYNHRMKSLHLRLRVLFVVALFSTLPLLGHADEGFWLFNRIPKAAIKQAYGVELTDAWLQRVQQAS